VLVPPYVPIFKNVGWIEEPSDGSTNNEDIGGTAALVSPYAPIFKNERVDRGA
jgi:hypothetical protein